MLKEDIDEASKAYQRGTKVRKLDATGNIIVEEGEAGTTTGTGTKQGGSLAGHSVVRLTETPGTIVLYIIIGIAGLALILIFSVHKSPSTISFALIVAIIVAGLIFDPEDKEKDLLKDTERITLQSNQTSSIETSSPKYFSLEKIDYFSNLSILSGTTYSIIYIAGVVLLASLIVVAMLPQFSNRVKSTAMMLVSCCLNNCCFERYLL